MKEVLKGYYSDPPGVTFYTQRKKPNGEVMKNTYGMDLLECHRGTHRTEGVHKQYVTTFGTWHTGVEMSEFIGAERRHRHNHRCSEHCRLGFPILGHYDTWLIDSLQILVMNNHGCLLYPSWSNASDYKDTKESFGTIPLHTEELDDAVSAAWKKIAESDKGASEIQLTPDQRFLCKAMGTELPFLPVHGEEEQKLFSRLVIEPPTLNDEQLAMEWCRYVEGIYVFPKLPVHLRNYRDKWERNRRVRDAVRDAKEGNDLLKELNNTLCPQETRDNKESEE